MRKKKVNKETRKDKQKRPDCLGRQSQPCLEQRDQRNKYRAQSWTDILGLADWISFISGLAQTAFIGTRKLPKFWFADMAPLGRSSCILGLEIYLKSANENKHDFFSLILKMKFVEKTLAICHRTNHRLSNNTGGLEARVWEPQNCVKR